MKEKKIPKGYMKVTPTQLSAICNAADNLSAMIGNGDSTGDFEWTVKHIDRFLKANGLKRKYK